MQVLSTLEQTYVSGGTAVPDGFWDIGTPGDPYLIPRDIVYPKLPNFALRKFLEARGKFWEVAVK